MLVLCTRTWGDRFLHGNQLLLQRIDPRGRGNVAADDLVAHGGLIDADLHEGVVDVRVRARRRSDDGALAGQDVGAAEAIDLTHIGTAEQRQQKPQARLVIGGNILLREKHCLAGATTHQGDRDANLFFHRLSMHGRPRVVLSVFLASL
ncbi:hypothetical protein M2165_000017 [Variovorax sp. TBS-050B]|nr:hypothetical protein [Variovorax sp. TBS-050B]